MSGEGFTSIPQDAVAVWANDNNQPLGLRYSQDQPTLFDVVVTDDNSLTCVPRVGYTHSVAGYVGAILTNDRSKVLWVNETKPLP